jgi:alpha-D-ribose 1-methylphosphonate 5-triphosphate synthase subunit PhnI
MYVAVKGGERAIENAHALLAAVRRGDPSVPELGTDQICEQLALAVDRVMSEGSLYDREFAALAIKQARGDLIEAIFLVRAYRTTLPRLGAAAPIDTGAMDIRRRISATFKDLPGGQVLGPTFDYTHRLLDHQLAGPFCSPPPTEVGFTRLRSLNSLAETRVDAVSAGEGAGAGVEEWSTAVPPRHAPSPRPPPRKRGEGEEAPCQTQLPSPAEPPLPPLAGEGGVEAAATQQNDRSRQQPTSVGGGEQAYPRVTDLLANDDLIEPSPVSEAPAGDLTREPLSFPAGRDVRLQNLARGDEGFLLALGYSTQRGYGRTHPFAGEIRFGEVEVEMFAEEVGFAVPLGRIAVTECQSINQFRGTATTAPRFTRGYGLAFGQSERKALAMALVDRALRAQELGEEIKAPAQDEEFVLSHSDNVQATGFVEHLKLPHYVDFQSELGLVRRLRETFAARGASSSPSPQSKSAVADFDHTIDGPKPAYTQFRLGEGPGGESGRGGKRGGAICDSPGTEKGGAGVEAAE